MLRDEVLAKLRADRANLERFGVKSIAVFGSVARGKTRARSDVDILVEYKPTAHPSLFDFFDLKEHLETVLDRRVDLATPKALHPAFRDGILQEAVYA